MFGFSFYFKVTGIEGTYRRTCESVMWVLRRNKDSLMAVLEAFVYDPLLNWRLMDTGAGGTNVGGASGPTSKGVGGPSSKARSTSSTNVPTTVASSITSTKLQNSGGADSAVVVSDTAVTTLSTRDSNDAADGTSGAPLQSKHHAGCQQPEALNKKALAIVTRVREKLTGRDFSHEEALDVKHQVELLIQQATSNENLCQCYIGWCPFW
ncbi:hypothetical protein J437_LFUL001476 [Ladona fulva]|uniref:Non-specific serine/threonine protein kinase n=1 Tax=Ladona fulva TaxID=123851 RepID=A0A8K0K6E1_LADFU|nr:hypothetical protein J437_LFUL001476 [Ladona fulva]